MKMNKTVSSVVALLVAATIFGAACSRQHDANTLNVLVLTPLTGPAAQYARYSKMGFDLAERDINAAGTFRINVKYVDSMSNPKDAMSALNQELLRQSPDAAIVQLSSVIKAVAPVFIQKKIPIIANAVAAPNVADPSKGVFRVFPTSDDVARIAIDIALKNGLKTIAVVFLNDEYGIGSRESIAKYAAQNGVRVIAEEPFTSLEKDFRTQWKRILEKEPASVFVAGYGPGYSAVLQQLAEQKYAGAVITDFTLTAPSVFQATGGVKEGTYVIAPDVSTEFQKTALAAYPDAAYFINVASAYDALQLLSQASRSAGASKSLTSQIAVASIEHGAVGKLKMAITGDAVIPMTYFRVKDGKLQIAK